MADLTKEAKIEEQCKSVTEQTKHTHQWDNYLHTAYVLVRTPLEHHCNLCSICHRLQCETTKE